MSDKIYAEFKIQGESATAHGTILCAVPVVHQKIRIKRGSQAQDYVVVDVWQIVEGTGPSKLEVIIKPL